MDIENLPDTGMRAADAQGMQIGHQQIEDWSQIPTVGDFTPPMAPPDQGEKSRSMPEGRKPTMLEKDELDALDRSLQENHQDKQRVAGSLYQMIVAKDTDAAEKLMTAWRNLCDKELQLAMKAFTLQAFSKERMREEKKDGLLGSTSLIGLGAAGKEHKPQIRLGTPVPEGSGDAG